MLLKNITNVNKADSEFLLPKVFGTSRRIIILETLLKNFIRNENGWINFSEIARFGKISTSTAKRILDELIRNEIVLQRENTYQSPVKNPERQVQLNSSSRISKELIFFYQKLNGFF